MNVTLINLSTKHDHAFLNLGALYIAATIRKNGHTVNFVDLVRHPLNKEDIEKQIKDNNPDLIAFSGIITTYYQLEELSNGLKIAFPNTLQIVGGSVGQSALNIIEKHTKVDFVCEGEGERTIIHLLKEISDLKNYDNVPNLHYRNKSMSLIKAKSEADKHYVNELDSLDFPAYDLVDMEFYIDYSSTIVKTVLGDEDKDIRAIPMIWTRGCPYECSFCYRLIRKWRHHSSEHVISNLQYLRETYNINAVQLNDELIFVNKKWFISLCEDIAQADLDFKFLAGGGKPDLVTEDIVVAMKKAGFKRIGYGLESGSNTILGLMEKKATVDQNMNAMEHTLKHGMLTTANFVFGHPGENKKTINETARFIDSLQKLQEKYGVLHDNFQYWYATAYHGSPLYEQAVSQNLIKDEREYLLNLTAQNLYPINLSEFSSANQLKQYVTSRLSILEIKKCWRRKSFKPLVKNCIRLLLDFSVFYGSAFKYHNLISFLSENSAFFRLRYQTGALRGQLVAKYDKKIAYAWE